jgi:hypothetical protein
MAIKFAELVNVPITLKSLDGIHQGRVMPKIRHSNPHSSYVLRTEDGKSIRITSGGPRDKVHLGEQDHQLYLEYTAPQKPTFVE